jgi:hypothetical protein
MARLRTLGIHGSNLPTKKAKTVAASDFAIGGILAQFERKFLISFLCHNTDEAKEIFGDNIISTYYGWDAVQGFFDNIAEVKGKLYIKSQVGNTGSAIDAVSATGSVADGAAAPLFTLKAAYKKNLEYGVSGNRTGYTVTNGTRFTTAIKTASLKTDTFIILDSVSGIKVGDIIKVVSTGGGGATVYKKITVIDEGTGKVTFAAAFHGTANPEIDDVVTIPGFQIKTFRKSITGIETEVEKEIGKVWCTMESEVTDFYVENIFAENKYLDIDDLDPATAVGATKYPVDVATVTYLTSGADGTAATTSAHWSYNFAAFDDDPIRFLACPETTLETLNKAGELYLRSRDDTPKWMYNITSNQSKSQLLTIGSLYQRSDDVMGVIVANWLEKEDPFSTSVNAPKREIPNVGHVMGNWIRSIMKNGIHYIPAVPTNPLLGVTGVVGDTFLNDTDRTELAEAGINVIQDISGTGIIVKNFFTPSTTKEFMFANGILMRDYIKVSGVDSLGDTENEPNSYDRIQASRSALYSFMVKLWKNGSTNNVPEGETFGQTIDPDTGKASPMSDHFQVQADIINNPQASIESGQRDIYVWFTYPTPAGSINIGVGLMLLG